MFAQSTAGLRVNQPLLHSLFPRNISRNQEARKCFPSIQYVEVERRANTKESCVIPFYKKKMSTDLVLCIHFDSYV